MLGRDLELSADVIADELAEEGVAFVLEQIVKADAAADEYLFDARQSLDLFNQVLIFAVVDLEVGAGLGGKTFATGANTVGQLLVAGGVTEVGSWAADVMDVTLKIGERGDLSRFFDHALLTARAHRSALVEGERAEVAAAKAAAVVRDGEFDLFDAGHAAFFLVRGVIIAHIG